MAYDSMHNKTVGNRGEAAVKNLYQRHFFKILVSNFYSHRGRSFGEIDFVAQKGKHIHFVEIKTRTSRKFGDPLEAITAQKRGRLILAAKYFFVLFRQFRDFQAHFDVATVEMGEFDKTVRRITIYSDCIDES